jgi:mannose-6-phosphate isomerase-like protein (cupin superfamily)
MTLSNAGGYVVGERDLPMQAIPNANASVRVPIHRGVGCQHLLQRVYRYEMGSAPLAFNAESEDILFVAAGRGEVRINGQPHALEADMGVYIPPKMPYQIINPHEEPLVVVSVLTPQPGETAQWQVEATLRADGRLTVREADQQPLAAGSRTFKLLVNDEIGCRNATQFIGFIPESKAPFHTHPYEEVIYIVEGAGVVHVGDASIPVSAGSSIYLPPELRHCIENPNPQPIRLLGVFCPAGSPASKTSEDSA